MPNDTSHSSTDKLFHALGEAEGKAFAHKHNPISIDTFVLCTIIVRATVVLADAIREAGRDR